MMLSSRSLWILASVCAAHGLALGGLLLQPAHAPVPVTPPSVIGVMLAAPEATPPQAAPPRSQPKQAPAPAPRQESSPPLPAAPPSERAPVSLPEEPALPAAPSRNESAVAPLTPVATPAPVVPAPVMPPRTDAAHLSNPAPSYPAMSRRLGEQGRVLLDVYILPDGTVGEIKIKQTSGYVRLDNAALDAVRRWRYLPARRGSEPIPFWYVQPIVYSLNS